MQKEEMISRKQKQSRIEIEPTTPDILAIESDSTSSESSEDQVKEPIRVYQNPTRIKQLLNPTYFVYEMSRTIKRPAVPTSDDILLEKSFQQQALDAVLEQVNEFKNSKTEWQRPADYFAENVKLDSQMTKIVENIAAEKLPVQRQPKKKKNDSVETLSKKKNDLVENFSKSEKRIGKDKKYGFQAKSKRNDSNGEDFSLKRFKSTGGRGSSKSRGSSRGRGSRGSSRGRGR